MTKRWRFRLWHLFALVAVFALGIWLNQHLGVEIVRHPRIGGYIALYWDREQIYDYNFFRFDAESSGSTASTPR